MRPNVSEIIHGLAIGAEEESVEVVHLVFFDESEDSELIKEGRAIASMLKEATH